MKSRILAIIVILGSFGLLTYLRLNEPKQPSAYQIGGSETVRRGEDLKTAASGFKAYNIGATRISLAENTTLTLEDTSTNTPKLAMREGRVITTGPVDISVRDTTVHATGTMSFIFYSWLDKLDVVDITNKAAYSVDTLHNVTTPELYNFNPSASSARTFYEWALSSNNTQPK
ncbi:MAG: hypothetical protein WC813_01750 [Patescibacteria group bacterium]|jgi:hypothetical protein